MQHIHRTHRTSSIVEDPVSIFRLGRQRTCRKRIDSNMSGGMLARERGGDVMDDTSCRVGVKVNGLKTELVDLLRVKDIPS